LALLLASADPGLGELTQVVAAPPTVMARASTLLPPIEVVKVGSATPTARKWDDQLLVKDQSPPPRKSFQPCLYRDSQSNRDRLLGSVDVEVG